MNVGPRPGEGPSLAKPLYVELAETLRQQIASGQHAVGSVLPPELTLCELHGVSRFTVRGALAQLQRQGYLARRPRIGSVVVAREPQQTFSVQTNSAGDVLRFSGFTDLHLVRAEDVEADATLSRELGCSVGEPWIKVSTYRTSPDTGMAVSWTDFYLRPEHRGIVPLIDNKRGPVRQLLDGLQRHPVERIEQAVEACAIPKVIADVLGVPGKSPALRAVYRLFSEGDEGRFYAAISLYPAGRFRLAQTLMRER